MVAAKTILNNLPLFKNEYIEVTENQSVNDIMRAIKKAHKLHAKDYDKIYKYFIGIDEFETCENIFDFLRANTKYFVETEETQTVKSPAAILHEKNIDCKNYALFSGGILDAINRSGEMYIPYTYRFVSDSIFNTNANHVFICAFPNDQYGEIWIDPIPPIKRFNDRINFFYSTDKNFKSMLYQVSGSNQIGFSINDAADVASSSGEPTAMAAGQIIKMLSSIFASRPNPNDWKGWDAQDIANGQFPSSSVRGYVLNDGDSVQNEAVNIASYIAANGLKNLVASGNPVTIPGKGWRDVTLDEIANKLRRGGLSNEAQQIKTMAANNPRIVSDLRSGVTNTASMNIYITLAIVGASIYFITKKK